MKRNVGNADRVLRALGGLGLGACAAMAPLPLEVRLGTFGSIGAYMRFTAIGGRCFGYGIMGKSTRSTERDHDRRVAPGRARPPPRRVTTTRSPRSFAPTTIASTASACVFARDGFERRRRRSGGVRLLCEAPTWLRDPSALSWLMKRRAQRLSAVASVPLSVSDRRSGHRVDLGDDGDDIGSDQLDPQQRSNAGS